MNEIATALSREAADVYATSSKAVGAAPTVVRQRGGWVAPFFRALAQTQPSPIDERLLAASRLGAALVLLSATLVDPHARQSAATLPLIAVYVLHAAGVYVHSLREPAWFLRRANLLQWIDLVWTVVATSVSGGVTSHVFLFFSFVVAAAAVRWGLWRSLLHGSIVFFVGVLQAFAASAGYPNLAFEWDVFLVRVPFVVIGFGLLFGILAGRLHALRYQATALTDLIGEIGQISRLKPAIDLTLRRLLEMFDARGACLVVEELETRTLHVCRAVHLDGGVEFTWTEAPRESRHLWRQSTACQGNACEIKRESSGWRAASLPAEPGGRLEPRDCTLPQALVEAEACSTVLTAPVEFARLWSGNLYVCDPLSRPRGELRLRFLRRVSLQVAPALLNLYLLRSLRAQAEARERARIARELHDGVLQSLTALEMRLEVLRRQVAPETPHLTAQIVEIRDLLHEQTAQARELMLRLRPLDVDAARLQGVLRDVTERFTRNVDVSVCLDWAVERLDLSPHECTEVVRILQEALVNIRRHSGARHVHARIESDSSAWSFIITDDGCGFGFTGRLTQQELETRNIGPRVIRERVVSLGGTLTIESSPAGARLAMTFPRYRTE